MTTEPRSWRFPLRLTKPLSLNDRRHWRVKAREVKYVRRDVAQAAALVGIPQLDRIVVELHYAPRDRRIRDPLNLVATLKPVEDGLVDAGVIPDDHPTYVVPTMPVLDRPTGDSRGHLYVIVREVLA